jgi:hypothetical protein
MGDCQLLNVPQEKKSIAVYVTIEKELISFNI